MIGGAETNGIGDPGSTTVMLGRESKSNQIT
jgi:hypothetical protein